MAFPFDRDPIVAFRFEVAIFVADAAALRLATPLCSAAFAECTGLEMSMEPKTLREGGNNYEQIHLPGPVTYGQLTLKRGMTDSLDLWRWFHALTLGGKLGTQSDAVVRVLEASGLPALTFRVHDCLPVKLKAPSLAARDTGLALEELTIAYSRFELVEATA